MSQTFALRPVANLVGLLSGCLLCWCLPLCVCAEESDWAFIDNDSIRVGIKLSSGGAIGWISAGRERPNLVNHYDHGRLIQQSYYGREDGSFWAKQPWRWNPVQGGDYRGNAATVLQRKLSLEELFVQTRPKHWASGADLPEVTMEQRITLQGPVARIRFRMEYTGEEPHPRRDQELPAVFLDRDYGTLVFETAAGIVRKTPGFPNERYDLPQHWAAYVNAEEQGLGVFVPQAEVLTCYRYSQPGERDACSYFAPLAIFAITPGLVYEYDCYITLGSLAEIRKRFQKLQSTRTP